MNPARRTAARTALIVAAVGLAVAAAMVPGVLGGPSAVDRLDAALRDSMPSSLGLGLDAFNLVGGLPVWTMLVVLAAALAWTRRRLALEVIGISLLVEALTTVLRVLVDRPRPPIGVNTELLVAAGFPSGHVARTVMFMATLLVVLPWARRHRRTWLGIALVVVGLMCIARVDAAAHFALDTLAGVLLGAAAVAGWVLLRDPEAAGELDVRRL